MSSALKHILTSLPVLIVTSHQPVLASKRTPVLLSADLQQRAVEFAGLLAHPDVARRNVTAMPKWEKRRSLLLRRMAEKEVTPSSLPW